MFFTEAKEEEAKKFACDLRKRLSRSKSKKGQYMPLFHR